MKILCDKTTYAFARWLRAAGYDSTCAAEDLSPSDLIALAKTEGRKLLTRDKEVAKITGARTHAIILKGEDIKACFAEMTSVVPIKWRLKPITRCPECNTPLTQPPQQEGEQTPKGGAKPLGKYRFCKKCNQLSWRGNHYERMLVWLEQFEK